MVRPRPLLFTAYTSPVGDLISSHGVSYHKFADAVSRHAQHVWLSTCTWTSQPMLDCCSCMVPEERSAAELLLSYALRRPFPQSTSLVAHCRSRRKSSLLAWSSDSHMRFDSRVRAVVRACKSHTRALRHIRKQLTSETAQTIACSVIGSWIDYCNSLLFGAPVAVIDKLQRVQNNVARVSANVSTSDHCQSHCTGSRYNSASGTRLLLPHARLCRRLSRRTSTNCCSVKRRRGCYGPLMLCGCLFPGRAPRQLSEHSVWLLLMSGTHCRSTFVILALCPLFVTNWRHTFLHDETYPPQRLCILSLDWLHCALQICIYVMLCYVIVRAIGFQDFQPVWSRSTNVTDGRTDGETDGRHAIARTRFAL